MNWVIHRKFKC